MLSYELTDVQEKHFYSCLPEVVVYDTRSKKTILLSSCAAEIIHRFCQENREDNISETELKQYCTHSDGFSLALYEQSLDQLLRMKIIELVE